MENQRTEALKRALKMEKDGIEFLEDPQGYFSQLERGTMSF